MPFERSWISLLPGNSGIEARDAHTPIGLLPRDIHLPNGLWDVRVGHFRNLRSNGIKRLSIVELDVAVRQNPNAPSPRRKEAGKVLPRCGGDFRVLVNLKDHGSAVAGRRRWARTAGHAVPIDSEISIIVDCHGGLGAAGAYDNRIVLAIKPLAGVAAREGEVPTFTKLPEYVARACSIGIIELQNPALMTHRKQQVAIGRINEGIAMRPIRQPLEMPIHIEMIECRPSPDHVSIRVNVQYCICGYVGCA